MSQDQWTLVEEWKRGRPSSPLLQTLREYSFQDFSGDIQAGITVGLIAVPQCMAFALLAGVSPIYGLYAGIVGAIFGSLLGSSHHLITGPTGIVALIVGNIVLNFNQHDPLVVVAYLSLLIGIGQVILCVAQVGDLARYFSLSVMNGFITGGALVILGDQLFELFGITVESSPYFLQRLLRLILAVTVHGEFAPGPFVIGTSTILFIVGSRLIHQRIPAILLSLIVVSTACYLIGIQQYSVKLIGEIPRSLPSLRLVTLEPELISALFGPAMALLLMGSVQTISIAKSISTKTLDPLDENQELMGQGSANIACGFFGGFPVAASFSRSFLNRQVGARTQLAGLFAGTVIALVLLLFAPLARYIPMPVLAGIIIVIAWDILNWEEIKISLLTTRRDRIVFITTFLSVLMLRLDMAIYLGFVVSVVLFLRKASQIDMREYFVDAEGNLKTLDSADESSHPEIGLVDINGEAFFGSAELILERIQSMCEESPDLEVILLRMKNAMDLDITGAMVLRQIAHYLTEQDKTLMICGTTPHVEEILKESGVADLIGRDKILVAQRSLLQSTRQAIERARAYIDDVVEGETEASEEEPPLRHTLKRKQSEDDHEIEEPLGEEKTGHYEQYDEES